MNVGEVITLSREDVLRDRWELANEHGGRVGIAMVRRRFLYPKAVGEAGGRTLTFAFAGWAAAHSEVKDEWGRVVGEMYREGWLSPQTQVILHEKEYVWHSSRLGDVFRIELSDGTPLVSVSGCGGFGTHGRATLHASLEHTEALSLVYVGLYQARIFEAEVAASILLIPAAVLVLRFLLT